MAKIEHRVSIKFCFKAGLSATEPLVLVQKVYGNEALNLSNVFRWYSRFRDGRDLVEDDERGGHPKSTRTEVNIAAVADLVKNDCRIALRIDSRICEHPQDCSSDSERGFWKEKVVCTFCSALLDTWAEGRSSHSWPRHYHDGQCKQFFFNKIITWDEIWRFAYDPETKSRSSEWVGETSPRSKKLKFQRSCIKTMLIIFFRLSRRNAQTIRTRGKIVNAEFCKGVMDLLLKSIQRVRPAA
jgi:hypothetical protein